MLKIALSVTATRLIIYNIKHPLKENLPLPCGEVFLMPKLRETLKNALSCDIMIMLYRN
jgi:hypothetical protein